MRPECCLFAPKCCLFAPMLFHSCKYCLGRTVWQQFISMEIVQNCTKIDCLTSNKYSHKKLTLMWIGIILLPDFFCNYCCQNSAGNISFKKSDFPHARVHSCFVKKYKTRAPQWENDFNTFSAYNSQYIMIFWILQQCWGMLVVLSGYPVYISNGYWIWRCVISCK